jgi:DNA-binding winged helix-turn-helix (wHTH) protein
VGKQHNRCAVGVRGQIFLQPAQLLLAEKAEAAWFQVKDVDQPGPFVRFGTFQLDLVAGELRRNGTRVRVPDQSIKVLAMLVQTAGEVVTREELHQKLWPNGTIVEFDNSINAAIRRLRLVLEDSAEEPQFIETLPRRGYRFLVCVEKVAPAETVAASEPEPVSVEPESRTISHYRVVRKLGQGAMGVVYQAEDTRLGRSVALKFLPEELSDDPRAQERFEREARAASALNHPNICTVYEVDQHEGVRFIAMEYVAGKSLDQLVGPEGLPVKDVLSYAVQIADALAKAHSVGIVHRDLKPSNIMVSQDGLVKLLDFGLAKVRAGQPAI